MIRYTDVKNLGTSFTHSNIMRGRGRNNDETVDSGISKKKKLLKNKGREFTVQVTAAMYVGTAVLHYPRGGNENYDLEYE